MPASSPLVCTYLTTFNPAVPSPNNQWAPVKASLPFNQIESSAGYTQHDLEQAFGATVDSSTGYLTIDNLINSANFISVRVAVSYVNYFNNQPLAIGLFTAIPQNNVYDLSTLLSSSSFNYANSGGNIVVLNDTVFLAPGQVVYVCLGDYGPGWGIEKISVSFISAGGSAVAQNGAV